MPHKVEPISVCAILRAFSRDCGLAIALAAGSSGLLTLAAAASATDINSPSAPSAQSSKHSASQHTAPAKTNTAAKPARGSATTANGKPQAKPKPATNGTTKAKAGPPGHRTVAPAPPMRKVPPLAPTVRTGAITPPPDPERALELQKEQAAQRQQLKDQLDALRRDIAAGEASRTEAADALANSERAISDANRHLHELTTQEAAVGSQLADLGHQREATSADITRQQQQLAQILHDGYVKGSNDPFRSLFSGDDPIRVQRDLQYSGYVSRAEADLLVSLQGNYARLQDLANQTEAHHAELSSIAGQAESEKATLVTEESAKRDTLNKISEKLQAQRAQAGALERDENRLAHVVEELGKVIERQARESREREKEREKDRERQKQRAAQETTAIAPSAAPSNAIEDIGPPTQATHSAGPRNELEPLAGLSGNFVKLRGRLHLPVKGELASRFGSARPDGGPSWKGVFIRAPQGAEVKAVAQGRVVFSEWLRGFGNLLIVDHGDQYLSIYGNNESLLKQAGDNVQSGEVLATVGNSGGNPETGLYFELRYQGKPFDPLAWASLR